MSTTDVEHGTYAGAMWHAYRREEKCIPCREAARQYRNKWREDPEKRESDRLMGVAIARAKTRLKNAHMDEYKQYYREELAQLKANKQAAA